MKPSSSRDCGVNPNPTAENLVDIAIATIKTHQALIGTQAKLSFLCYSTKGSAKGELVDKMASAAAMTKARIAELGIDALVDGELQADAALVPSVAAAKAPDSPLKGQANILISRTSIAAISATKITQRLAAPSLRANPPGRRQAGQRSLPRCTRGHRRRRRHHHLPGTGE